MDRLGLGYDVLSKINPRLVYGGSSGFGLDGPYRDLAAMDVTIQAMSGITNATGDADGPPTKAGAAVCVPSTGLVSATSGFAIEDAAKRVSSSAKVNARLKIATSSMEPMKRR